MVQVNLDRKTGALVDGYDVETLNLSDNVPVLEGAFNVNGIEVSVCRLPAAHPPKSLRFLCARR